MSNGTPINLTVFPCNFPQSLEKTEIAPSPVFTRRLLRQVYSTLRRYLGIYGVG
jgi:hypothetical protein